MGRGGTGGSRGTWWVEGDLVGRGGTGGLRGTWWLEGDLVA